jgi:hypothetical protein
MDEAKTESFVTITEQLKSEKNYKIGVVSSVNLNHATPAAFYAISRPGTTTMRSVSRWWQAVSTILPAAL